MPHRAVRELARVTDCRLIGDGDITIGGLASVASAQAGDLVFVEDAKLLPRAIASPAAAIVTGEFGADRSTSKPLLIARQPKLAFARIATLLAANEDITFERDASAVVDATARLAAQVAIGALAVIGKRVAIGERSVIGPGVIIGDGVRIGADCVLHARAVIASGSWLGDRVVVQSGSVLGGDGFGYVRDDATGRYHKFPQIGTLLIGDDVEIGANVTIDRGALDATTIARGVKIDNLVHIGHSVSIGEDVIIAGQSGISGSSIIERGAVLAGRVGIADHVRIGAGVIMGANSGVPTRKIIEGAGQAFWGCPARPLRQHLRELASLARFTRDRESADRAKRT